MADPDKDDRVKFQRGIGFIDSQRADAKYNNDEALTGPADKTAQFNKLDQSGQQTTPQRPEELNVPEATEKIDKNQSVRSSLDPRAGERGTKEGGRPGEWMESQGYSQTNLEKKENVDKEKLVNEQLRNRGQESRRSQGQAPSNVNKMSSEDAPKQERDDSNRETMKRDKVLEPLPRSGSDASQDKFGLYSQADVDKSMKMPGDHKVSGVSKRD